MNRRQQAGDWQKSDKSSVYLTSPQVGETDKASVIFDTIHEPEKLKTVSLKNKKPVEDHRSCIDYSVLH